MGRPHYGENLLVANPLAKLLEVINVFGEKSAPADSIATALAEKHAQSERLLPAMVANFELGKSSSASALGVGNIDHTSQVRDGKLEGNPYWVELGKRYPIIMDWLSSFPGGGMEGHLPVKDVVGKYSKEVFQKRHEEAKQFIGEDFEPTLDSLIQAYGFDKLK